MITSLNSLPNDVIRRRLLDIHSTAEFCGRSVPEIRRLLRHGLFPKPLKLNGRRLSWQLGQLVDYIDSKVEGNSKAEGSSG